MTHAFFKACLFLGAGSVIHGCNGEQDMRKMGGLRKYMPTTHWTFLVATIAIAGIPPLAGFFSKDEILASAFFARYHDLGAPWSSMPLLLWAFGVIAATFTAFYMFRAYYLTFWGEYRGAERAGAEAHAGAQGARRHPPTRARSRRSRHGHAGRPHESPASMTGVLAALAILAIVGGWVGLPLGAFGVHHPNLFQRWLSPVLWPLGGVPFEFHVAPIGLEWFLILLSIGVAVAGILIASHLLHRSFVAPAPQPSRRASRPSIAWSRTSTTSTSSIRRRSSAARSSSRTGWPGSTRTSSMGWSISSATSRSWSSAGDPRSSTRMWSTARSTASAWSAQRGSTFFRKMQTGFVQNYALVMGGGVVLLAVVYLLGRW